MKIIKRLRKLFLKKECYYCRKNFKIYKKDLNIERKDGKILWAECECPRCKRKTYIADFDVKKITRNLK